MDVRDSRRLTGANVIWERPGAVLDIAVGEGDDATAALAAWERHARRLLDAVGWRRERLAHRVFPGGLSLALSAPFDALYAATEINEHAWAAATAELAATPLPELAAAATHLRAVIGAEVNPPLVALQAAAAERGVAFLSDDEQASVGLGRGSRVWPVDALPAPGEVEWAAVHDVPVALVTGTNGKTTTVRLLAAIAAAGGRVSGLSSTDWIRVGDRVLDSGDYAGPGGARRVLRDPRVEVALLETARGGMLRRGLAVARADVALVTNIAEDHLGEFGIVDLGMLAETKMVVARVAAQLVLNADDEESRKRAPRLRQPVTWLSLDPDRQLVRDHLAAGRRACLLDGDRLVLCSGDARHTVAAVDEVPITLGGAARHNVYNALGAIAVAAALGLDQQAIRAGLLAFDSSPEANPGRLNRFHLGGVDVLVDFAHNPHGLQALLATARRLDAERRLVVIGQAGDRDDDALRALARLLAAERPQRVVIKDMPQHLRGRGRGEIPRLLADELCRHGTPSEAIGFAVSELEAVRHALGWARPGDLLVLLSHAERDAVLALIARLGAEGWAPGDPLPA